MAGSLFKNYPYDIPTEAFSLALFTQAFATVQASIVHLQDVTLSKRFALVPLGPPLLSYSSTSKVSDPLPSSLPLTSSDSLTVFSQSLSLYLSLGLTLSKRFALVPLGPPLLSYSSTSKVSHSLW